MTPGQASTYRYYVNKKLTDKPFFKGMVAENVMRSSYNRWKKTLPKWLDRQAKAHKDHQLEVKVLSTYCIFKQYWSLLMLKTQLLYSEWYLSQNKEKSEGQV